MCAAPTSSDQKPRLYLFFGNDEAAMQKLVQALMDKVMKGSMGDMNITRFQENPRVGDVRDAAYVMPLFIDRRLVVVSNAGEWVKGVRNKEEILKLIEGLPDSTALILQLNLELERSEWKDFKESHWLRKWVKDQPRGRVYFKECSLPASGQMPDLIMREVAEKKGAFTPEAAQELARAIGTDTMIASQEIDKLLNYVDFQRAVTPEDVRLLSPDIAPVNIFDMVDAIGERKYDKAIRYLRRLLEAEMPIPLFGMIIRQFRLIILAREVLDRGGRKQQIATALKVPSFVAEKIEKQASLFNMEQLKEIYRRLLNTDEAMKTSQIDPKLAIELFVSEMSIQ